MPRDGPGTEFQPLLLIPGWILLELELQKGLGSAQHLWGKDLCFWVLVLGSEDMVFTESGLDRNGDFLKLEFSEIGVY